MEKIKDKLIHLLGGYTFCDMLIKTRPMHVRTEQCPVITIKVGNVIRKDRHYSWTEYMDLAKKDMAYKLGDTMLKESLIEFRTREEQPDTFTLTALVKVVAPLEVSK